jgi:hypothetical protein
MLLGLAGTGKIQMILAWGIALFFLLILLWILLRLAVFFEARSDWVSLPPEVASFCTALHRLILIVLPLSFLVFVLPHLVFALAIGNAFHANPGDFTTGVIFACFGLYALAAVVLNFPGFSLALLRRLFLPTQVLLLPCLITIMKPMVFLLLALILGSYAAFWKWNLVERVEKATMGE